MGEPIGDARLSPKRAGAHGRVMKLYSLLGLKLFFLILAILLVAFGGILFINLELTRSHLIAGKIDSARSPAELIQGAIHDNMLRNQSGAVSTIIKNVSRIEGIEGLRVYNKRGEIMYTSHPEERGQAVDIRAEACVSCHDGT